MDTDTTEALDDKDEVQLVFGAQKESENANNLDIAEAPLATQGWPHKDHHLLTTFVTKGADTRFFFFFHLTFNEKTFYCKQFRISGKGLPGLSHCLGRLSPKKL